jgi:hypothetical protein
MTKNKSKCVTAIVMIAAILVIAVAASALAQNAVAITDPNQRSAIHSSSGQYGDPNERAR